MKLSTAGQAVRILSQICRPDEQMDAQGRCLLKGFGVKVDFLEPPSPWEVQVGEVKLSTEARPDALCAIEIILKSTDKLETQSTVAENAMFLDGRCANQDEQIMEREAKTQSLISSESLSINGFECDVRHLEWPQVEQFVNGYKLLVDGIGMDHAELIGKKLMANLRSNLVQRFDVRSPALMAINDLSKDPRYKRFPSSYSGLFTSSMIARNAVVLTVVCDLSSECKSLILELFSLNAQLTPMQLTMLLYDVERREECKAIYSIYQRNGIAALEHRLAQAWDSNLELKGISESNEMFDQSRLIIDRLCIESFPRVFVNGIHVPYLQQVLEAVFNYCLVVERRCNARLSKGDHQYQEPISAPSFD